MNDEFFAEFDAMFAEFARKAQPGGIRARTPTSF